MIKQILDALACPVPSCRKPLKLADFPATKDGDLARKICQAWAGLRGQYYSRVKSDTSSQLSQWFSGPDWTTVHADGLQLTADRACSSGT